jgi:isopenicillin N synthase-like dioxygenase
MHPQMRKDDLVGNCKPLPCPDLIKKNWGLLQDYVRNCRAAIDLMFSHLERNLQLPIGTLANLHRIGEGSGDHVRFNKTAPNTFSEAKVKQNEHTDFGSLTILFNWLGGLQIRLPETSEWVYVRPIPRSAVVNLGDAMVKFTAGLLRSNIHRVAPPLPPQDSLDRYSLVYFSRPENAVVLRRLEGGLIDAQPQAEKKEVEMTSEEWILRRSVGDLRGVYTHNGGLELRPPLIPDRVVKLSA